MVNDDRLGFQLENAKLIKMYDEIYSIGDREHLEDNKPNVSFSEFADRLKTCRLTMYCGVMRGNNTWDDLINYYFQWNWTKSLESSYNDCLADYKELKQKIRSDIDNGWVILEKGNPYLDEIMSDEFSMKELARFVRVHRDYVKLMSSNNNLIMGI